jgi:hypothetical protein
MNYVRKMYDQVGANYYSPTHTSIESVPNYALHLQLRITNYERRNPLRSKVQQRKTCQIHLPAGFSIFNFQFSIIWFCWDYGWANSDSPLRGHIFCICNSQYAIRNYFAVFNFQFSIFNFLQFLTIFTSIDNALPFSTTILII